LTKQLFITQVSCLLDRGSGSTEDPAYFTEKRHDDLVAEFQAYLEMHVGLLGQLHIERTQALNDHGTDLLVRMGEYRVGFQIKSHFDVSERNFAANVKRQMTESFAHGLDKWYVLICCPLQADDDDFSGKISHLINEFSFLQTRYPAIYGPLNTIKYFNRPEALTRENFNLELQRRAFQQTTLDELVAVLRAAPAPAAVIGRQLADNIDAYQPMYPQTLNKFVPNGVMDLTEEQRQLTVDLVPPLIERLRMLPVPSREFLTLLIQRARPGQWHNAELGVLYGEVLRAIGIDRNELDEELAILERHGLVRLEDVEGQTRIDIKGVDNDWVFWPDLKEFCQQQGIQLREFVVNLNFQLLD
jgi:DNA-binding transcriptional ArsR family regulator